MDHDALMNAWAALRQAAGKRGLILEPAAPSVSPETAKRLSSRFDVMLPADALGYFSEINGMRCDGNVLLGGQFRAPPFSELLNEYRAVWSSPSDKMGELDCIFPIFISEFGELLGFDRQGVDACLYEVSLSNPQPLLAFSSLSMALCIFAAFFDEACEPRDLAVAQRIHAQIDPAAAKRYWR